MSTPAEGASETVRATVLGALILSPQRTQTQDEEFTLFEIAVRAFVGGDQGNRSHR